MGFLTIDEEKCTRCGLCAKACPVGIIVVGDAGPGTIEKIEKGCITCGHCVAACPSAALSHCRMAPGDCSSIEKGWRLDPLRLEQLIKGRRSIRRYRPEPVERAVLERLFEIVRYAPTGENSQSVKWLVIGDSQEINQLSSTVIDWVRLLLDRGVPGIKGMLKSWEMGEDPILRHAPTLVIAHGAADDPMVRASATIALATMELAALSFGLGACWAGFLHHAANSTAEVHNALSLPPGNTMCGGLMIGYPEFEYARIPARNPASVTWR